MEICVETSIMRDQIGAEGATNHENACVTGSVILMLRCRACNIRWERVGGQRLAYHEGVSGREAAIA